ncbi:MAG: tetratricopeptide repeat protein [Deltaproteobacteria bacterium]|nr:tetratricopeptide repeat protein [Deltaproteobacteria bacterium]
MDSERMAVLDALMEEALELPREERGLFVSRVGDEELRHELAELLHFTGPCASLLEGYGVAADGPVAESDALLNRLGTWVRDLASGEAVPDRRVGAYRLVEQIGSGGMGIVYRADRADGAFEQQVALKLLPAGSLSPEAIRLFEQERQFLAGLNHENIARLLDGGVDSLGRPFLAMELVDGLPIERYCDQKRLDIRARLDLFGAVCRAVQYAHQNLIVHRDLKPGNILVTHEGVVKLLDFGIASVSESAPRSGIDSRGPSSARLLSPSYASPEQIEGQPVTTSSDVYSLGVVLFQLVTGRLPYETTAGTESLFAQVLKGNAPLASDSLSKADGSQSSTQSSRAALRSTRISQLRKQVAGDLDAVVSKALAADPSARYPTAEQLGKDLRRWLEDLPVTARRSTPTYLVRKWVKRHAVVTTLAALAVAAVSLALVAALWQAREATRARGVAEQEAAVAQRISQVLVEVLERAKTDPVGEKAIVETLLDPAAARIGEELADSPEVQAALMDALGRAYLNLGRYEDARPLAEEALVLRQRLHPGRHKSVALSQRLLGEMLASFGELDRSAKLLRESVETLQIVAPEEPLEIARGETILSHALGSLGHDARCEALRRRSLDLYRQHLGDHHPTVATSLNYLGGALVRRGKAAEAESLFHRSLDIHRAAETEDRLAIVSVLGHLTQARLQRGLLEEAEVTAREAMELSLLAYGPSHPNRSHSIDNLAQVLVARGAVEEAEPLARQALEIYSRGNPGGRTRTAVMHGTLLQIALSRQDLEGAAEHLEAAQKIVTEITPKGHLVQAMVRSLEGQLLLAQGRREEALTALESAFEELHGRQAPASLALRQTAATLVQFHQARGDEVATQRYLPWTEPPSL